MPKNQPNYEPPFTDRPEKRYSVFGAACLLSLGGVIGWGASACELPTKGIDGCYELWNYDGPASINAQSEEPTVIPSPLWSEVPLAPLSPLPVEPSVAPSSAEAEQPPFNKILQAGSADMPCSAGEIIKKGETQEKEVAITIDDGPSPTTTGPILDTLAETETKATFFLVAQRLNTAEGKDLADRILEEGHEIAGHSYSHALKNPELNAMEHDKSNEIFTDVLGAVPYAYRTPGFNYTDTLKKEVAEANQCFIDVSTHGDTKDWKGDFLSRPEAEALLKANDDIVLDNLTPGTIILAHDQIQDSETDGGRNRARITAANHIRYLIKGIYDRGYTPVTVEELLR